MLSRAVDVLVPTCGRSAALAVTLAGLAGQQHRGLRVVVSDQAARPVVEEPAVAAGVRLLRHHGVPVEVHRHLPRRGVAEQRAFLLSRAGAPYVLCLDDDVWLESWAVGRLVAAARALRAGFAGMAPQGLSYVEDDRPHERVAYEEWAGPVRPERVRPGGPGWERFRLHNAANLVHLARDLRLAPGEWRAYKVSWVGGCVLYDAAALRACGGFDFWDRLPDHAVGEDVLAQLRVLERFGGAGLVPSGAYHLEAPTTVPRREVQAYRLLR